MHVYVCNIHSYMRGLLFEHIPALIQYDPNDNIPDTSVSYLTLASIKPLSGFVSQPHQPVIMIVINTDNLTIAAIFVDIFIFFAAIIFRFSSS